MQVLTGKSDNFSLMNISQARTVTKNKSANEKMMFSYMWLT